MKQDGLTIVEMLIVIMIVGVLLVIASLNFRDWTTKYNIESQINELHADLMNARVEAANRNRLHFVEFSAGQYTVTDDSDDDGVNEAGDARLVMKILKNPISWTGGPELTFDSRGLASSGLTVSVTNPVNAAFDCVAVSMTRIYMGKMSGGACVQR